MDKFRTIIVPVSHVALARSLSAALGSGGVGMFISPLSTDGLEPATHYVSTGKMPEQFLALIPNQTTGSGGDATALAEIVNDPDGANLGVNVADIQAMFDAADITEQEPFTAFERLGINLVVPAEVTV